MKFSYNWLRRHLDTNIPASEIANGITSIGIEVENCENKYEYLSNFTIAIIEEAGKHPNADKLKLCKVFDGKNRYNVVCGAHNARAGIKVVLAKPGVIIPDTGSKLKTGNIRGIKSEAMMCSKRELMLGTDHDGIIEVDNNANIGDSALNALSLDETIFEVSITPNRSDCFSVHGIARDASVKGLGRLITLEKIPFKSSILHDININFANGVDKFCKGMATIVIKGAKNLDSPDWMKKFLKSADLNPISAIVDITNFINFDLGQPLHAYDISKINNNNIDIRFANNGEFFEDLKGRKYDLTNDVLVSADNNGPLCLLGLIGGERSSCSSDTVDIILEAAWLDPIYISTVGKKLNLTTDARTRFERGIDNNNIIYSLQYAAHLITTICGGQYSEIKITGNIGNEPIIIPFSKEVFEKLSGISIEENLIKSILTNLGCEIDDDFNVKVPSYRHDINIKEDLVEEILRIYGYEHCTESKIEIKHSDLANTTYKNIKKCREIRRRLCFQGLDECMNYSFISEKQATLFGEIKDYLEVENPISNTMSYLRRSLLPGIITGYERIINKSDFVSGLFELGNIFENIDEQKLYISGVRGEILQQKRWNKEIKYTNAYDVKSDLCAVLECFGIQESKLEIRHDELPKYYHPAKSGIVYLGPKIIGVFGEAHPALLKQLDLKEKLFFFEVNISELRKLKQKSSSFIEKKLQNIERDFAFLSPIGVQASSYINAIRKCNNFIEDVILFDLYNGPNIEQGYISMAIRVVINQKDSVMSDSDIKLISNDIINSISNLGGCIRD